MVWPFQLSVRYHQLEVVSEDLLSFSYLAFDSKTQKTVMVWVYKPEYISESLGHRILELSLTLQTLVHPAILHLIDCIYDGAYLCTVYDYIPEMQTLDEYLASRVLSSRELWSLASQLVPALTLLDSKRLFSGQVTFSGIYVSPSGKPFLARCAIYMTILKTHLSSFEVVDDVMFYPPETLHQGEYVIQSDIYAFGVLLFYLFSRKWPFTYTLRPEELKENMLRGVDVFEPIFSPLPEKIRGLIYASISLDPLQRFRSFSDLVRFYQGKLDVPDQLPVQKYPKTAFDSQEHLQKSVHFLKRHRILVSLGVTLLVVLGVLNFFFQRYMNVYKDVPIPSVVGLSYDEAVEVLKQSQLDATLSGTRLSQEYEEGVVVDTKPPVGRLVKQHRLVHLYVSSGKLSYALPQFIGKSYDELLEEAHRYLIRVKLSSEAFSSYPKGTIISQTPQAGTLVSSNGTVSVVVSKGSPVQFSAEKVSGSLFSSPTLYKVTISFQVPADSSAKEVRVVFKLESELNTIYSEVHQPSDRKSLSFELEEGGTVLVYFGSDFVSYVVGQKSGAILE